MPGFKRAFTLNQIQAVSHLLFSTETFHRDQFIIKEDLDGAKPTHIHKKMPVERQNLYIIKKGQLRYSKRMTRRTAVNHLERFEISIMELGPGEIINEGPQFG